MNFLKKLGEMVKIGAPLLKMFAPVITQFIPGTKDDRIAEKATDTLEQVSGIVMQAEIFGAALALTGAQKLTGAAPAVAQLILRSSMLAGKKVKDQARFEVAVIGLASNIAEILSSVEEEKY